MSLAELGSRIPSYSPTFDFPTEFISEFHKLLATCPIRDGLLIQIRNRRWFGRIIDGWLRREDALKLYEIAYFATGDILELGSYRGLSTFILAHANFDSPHKKIIYSVDLDPSSVAITRRNLRWRGLGAHVQTMCGDALRVVEGMASTGKQFAFVFVDHSHACEDVYSVCCRLARIVAAGGFCLFHDFNDSRNREEGNVDYGVYQGVTEGLGSEEFEFFGIYGCTALYRRRLNDHATSTTFEACPTP